jgi:hypothetical protein
MGFASMEERTTVLVTQAVVVVHLVTMECNVKVVSNLTIFLISNSGLNCNVIVAIKKRRVICLYNKQNNTWTFGDMNLSSCVQARYLSRSLHSLVRYRA